MPTLRVFVNLSRKNQQYYVRKEIKRKTRKKNMLDILVRDICIKVRKAINSFNCGDTVRGRCKCVRGISIHMLALVCRICGATISFRIRLCGKDGTYYLAIYEGERKIFPVFNDEIGRDSHQIAGYSCCRSSGGESSGGEGSGGEDECYIRLADLPVKMDIDPFDLFLLGEIQRNFHISGWNASENLGRYCCVRELILRNRNMSFSDYSSAVANGILVLFPNLWELAYSDLGHNDFASFVAQFSPPLRYLADICGNVSGIISERGSVGRSAFWSQKGDSSMDGLVSILDEDTKQSERYRKALLKVCQYIIDGNMHSAWERIDQQISQSHCIDDAAKQSVKSLLQMPLRGAGKYRKVSVSVR